MKERLYSIFAQVSKKYTITLLADLHGKFKEDVIIAAKNHKADLITIAGDLVADSFTEAANSFLHNCAEVAPTFMSLGNHDYMLSASDLRRIRQLSVKLLNDEWDCVNGELVIGGLTSSFYHKCEKYDPKLPMELFPEVAWLKDFEQQRGYKILLDHHPENFEPYTAKRNIDLILSGHNHGGQIRLFGKGIYARNQGVFPKYDGGFYENKLVVSRGLANTMFIPRIFNPTEILIIELNPQSDKEF